MSKSCFICVSSLEENGDILHQESPIHPELLIHGQCMMTQEYRQWTERQGLENGRYGRYLQLITLGRDIECPSCSEIQKISPKAIGMGAGGWEVNCDSCHRLAPDYLSVYHKKTRTAYERLERLRARFLDIQNLQAVEADVVELAGKHDRRFNESSCECGGSFSIAAKPRCVHCGFVVEETYFHVTYEAAKS